MPIRSLCSIDTKFYSNGPATIIMTPHTQHQGYHCLESGSSLILEFRQFAPTFHQHILDILRAKNSLHKSQVFILGKKLRGSLWMHLLFTAAD